MSSATTILVKNKNGGAATVDLGPSWFVQHQQAKVKLGDKVSVTGSKVALNGRSFILARKVVEGNKALYLREVNGFPMWVATRGHVDVLGPSAGKYKLDLGVGESASSKGPVALARPAPPDVDVQPEQPPIRTLNGTLQQMTTITDPKTGQPETFIVVNTPQGTVNVDLGPQWFIQQQAMNWTPGGNVVVNAVPPVVTIPNGGNPIYLANTLSYGNQYMVLRPDGITIWNPWTGF